MSADIRRGEYTEESGKSETIESFLEDFGSTVTYLESLVSNNNLGEKLIDEIGKLIDVLNKYQFKVRFDFRFYGSHVEDDKSQPPELRYIKIGMRIVKRELKKLLEGNDSNTDEVREMETYYIKNLIDIVAIGIAKIDDQKGKSHF